MANSKYLFVLCLLISLFSCKESTKQAPATSNGNQPISKTEQQKLIVYIDGTQIDSSGYTQSFSVTELVKFSQVDILWVMDSSSILDHDRKSIAWDSEVLVDVLLKHSWLNWKMGVISTNFNRESATGSKQLDFINSNTVNPKDKLIMSIEETGNLSDISAYHPEWNDVGIFRSAYYNFSKIQNFLRSNAALILIFVSNEDKVGSTSFTERDMTVFNFLDTLEDFANKLSHVKTFGFFGASDFGNSISNWTFIGSQFEYVSNRTNGTNYALNGINQVDNFRNVGNEIINFASKPKLKLSHQPTPESIKLIYSEKVIPGGPKGYWFYDESINSIVIKDLSFIDDQSKEIEVKFTKAN